MTPERRKRIQTHADVVYRPQQLAFARAFQMKLNAARSAASKTHNAGAMVPAEARCFVADISERSLALARAIADAYTAFGEAVDDEAKRRYTESHENLVGVRKSVFISEANLRAVRTRRHPAAGLEQLHAAARNFRSEASGAFAEGIRILAEQGVRFENKTELQRPGFVVDTCIFNWLLDRRIRLSGLPLNGQLFVTHIQFDEINQTSDAERRGKLFLRLAELKCDVRDTESFVWDMSHWDAAKWSESDLFDHLKTALDGRNKRKKNNTADALIGETALLNQMTLITADSDLNAVVLDAGGRVMFFSRDDAERNLAGGSARPENDQAPGEV